MLTKERLLHPATIIATSALLVALSGAGYAATKIGTAQLKNNAVTTPKIKNSAVNTAKLKNSAVNSSKLASGAVAAADLGNNAVTSAKLANDAVTAAKLAGGAVGTSALATNAVDAAKLANGAVTTDKLGPNAVTGAKIAGATITAANIASGQVVKGGGNFVTGRALVTDAAANVTALTIPGVGLLRATCVGGITSINFFNEGAAATVHAWGNDDAGVESQQTATLATGNGTTPIEGTATGVLGLTYQVAPVGNLQQVTTVEISGAPAAPNCAVVGSALTTG